LAAEARTLGLHSYRSDDIMTLSHQVLVCVSGVGPATARIAGARLLAHGANALLSWGTAVALDSQLTAGHLLVPSRVLGVDRQPQPVSRGWQRQLHRQLSTRFAVDDRPLIATPRILTRPAQKRRLFDESGAVAADMESAELALVARDAGVPFAALRAVADRADSNIPDWITGSMDGYGRVRITSILLPLIVHPADWPDIAGLARDFRAATNTLKAIRSDGDCADLIPDLSVSEARAIA